MIIGLTIHYAPHPSPYPNSQVPDGFGADACGVAGLSFGWWIWSNVDYV